MRTINAKALNDLIRQDEDVLLLNVLSQEDFEKEHIPGSHNIPESREDFVSQVEKLAGRKDRPVVVYCASKDCQASPSAARKLTEAGFEHVTDFEGGMAAWKLGNFPVDKGAPSGVSS